MIFIDLTAQKPPRFRVGDMVRIMDREPVPASMRGTICKVIEERRLEMLAIQGKLFPALVYTVDAPCGCGCGRPHAYCPEEILEPAPPVDLTPAGSWECTGWTPPPRGQP